MGRLVCTPLLLRISGPNKNETVIRMAQVAKSGQAWRHSSDFTKKTDSVDVVEAVLHIHGQEASFIFIF